MRAFADLSYPAQIRAMREVAKTALQQFNVYYDDVKFLSHRDNTQYRVVGTYAGGPTPVRAWWVLRVYGTSHTPQHIRSELAWLHALRADTALSVPEPLLNLDGDLLTTVALPRLEARHCAVFRWIPGKQPDPGKLGKVMERAGAAMAALHQHGATWTPPWDFVRPAWKLDRVYGPQSALHDAMQGLGREDREVFEQAAVRIRDTEQALGTTPNVYGLIHSDMNLSNMVVKGSAFSVIDFEECGAGWHLFDIAVTLYELEDYPTLDIPKLSAAFLDHYTRVRPLPPGYEAHLAAFRAMRVLDLLNWFFGSASPKVRARSENWMALTLSELRAFLEGT